MLGHTLVDSFVAVLLVDILGGNDLLQKPVVAMALISKLRTWREGVIVP